MASGKDKIACFECGAKFSIDMGKVPAEAQYLKCLNCGAQMPLLRRLLKAKSQVDAPAGSGVQSEPAGKAQAAADADHYMEESWDHASSLEDEDAEQGNWLATYADMISILLIFFILMFAISSVDKKKFEIVMQSINHALGGNLSFPQPQESLPLPSTFDPAKLLDNLRNSVKEEKDVLSGLRKQLESFIAENDLQDKFVLSDEDDGLVIIAQDVVMFDSGSAEIRQEVRENLRKIAMILRQIKNAIAVEGHTDDVPIRSARFSSNWELSVMRATNVIHFFVEECGLEPSQLTAAGYAYYRPRYSFSSQDRGKNRRIEVKVKKKYSDELVHELLKSS